MKTDAMKPLAGPYFGIRPWRTAGASLVTMKTTMLLSTPHLSQSA